MIDGPRHLSLRALGPHGFHKMAYVEWGDATSARAAVCVHGLTRQGRDFDRLAQALSRHSLVACPDVVGRGQSDWLADKTDYSYPLYLGDLAALIARLGVDQVDWVGTSMGGIIGMLLAAQPEAPIRRLVINDIGPFIPKAGLERLGAYVGRDPRFADLAAAEAYMREVAAPFGKLSDADWRHLTQYSFREEADGSYRLRYDPAIAVPFRTGEIKDIEMWRVWDQIRCPVLLLRGAESDLLTRDTALEMTRRGPRARLVEFAGCGHAPALMAPDQIAAVAAFLEEGG